MEPTNAYPDASPRQRLLEAGLFLLQLVFLLMLAVSMLLQSNDWMQLFVIVQKCVVIALVVLRRPASSIDRSLPAWGAVIVGTYGLAFSGPLSPGLPSWVEVLSVLVLCLGYLVVISGILSLGVSFGMLPANRGVVTRGLFRWIRHPYFAGTTLIFIGSFLQRCTWRALVVLLICQAAQMLRMQREEALLSHDDDYRAYREKVKYRLLYGIY